MIAEYFYSNLTSQNDYFLSETRHYIATTPPHAGATPRYPVRIYTEIHRSGFSTVNHNYN